ncbi:excinuclease ABC [Striga asiatica]|uniref:Excinuclease ABC n=1 Tax=Striga asiatica TaxID=4170 RepID=A0A5A7P174_STRAF|nr:excinuclease ABC [Striga asiatica]
MPAWAGKDSFPRPRPSRPADPENKPLLSLPQPKGSRGNLVAPKVSVSVENVPEVVDWSPYVTSYRHWLRGTTIDSDSESSENCLGMSQERVSKSWVTWGSEVGKKVWCCWRGSDETEMIMGMRRKRKTICFASIL